MSFTLIMRIICCFFICLSLNFACQKKIDNPIENQILEIDSIREYREIPIIRPHQKQSANYILGDKILTSYNDNWLICPELIRLIGAYNDSLTAYKQYKFLNKKDSSVQFLNTESYFYTGKDKKFIVYQIPKENEIYEGLTTYPLQDRLDSLKVLHKIRLNDFDDDKDLLPSQLKSSYINYNVEQLKESSIYRVTQKKQYDNARPFTRLIKYDANNVQSQVLTINDLMFNGSLKTKEGNFILSFSDPIYGARFNYNLPVCKLVLVDQELNVINEIDIFYKDAFYNSTRLTEDGYIVQMEFHLACSMCNSHFCIFEIELDKNFNQKGIKIIQQPESYQINLDSIKNKTFFLKPLEN